MVLIFYVAKEFNGTLRKDRVPEDALPKQHVIAGCYIFFNLSSNITNTSFPHSVREEMNISSKNITVGLIRGNKWQHM
jgi:hypothetical protein